MRDKPLTDARSMLEVRKYSRLPDMREGAYRGISSAQEFTRQYHNKARRYRPSIRKSER